MQVALQFIRTHLVALLCGVASLAFIGVGVVGMTSGRVAAAMEKRKQEIKAESISGLKSSAKNDAQIAAEQERGKRYEQEYSKLVSTANTINAREPLLEGVFPSFERLDTPFRFRERYKLALEQLPRPLQAEPLPNEAEIQEEMQNVEDDRMQELEKQEETRVLQPGEQPPQGRQPAIAPPVSIGGSRGGGRSSFAGGASAGLSDEPRFNPLLRAQVNKAKNIRCYVGPASFHRSPILDPTNPRPPSLVDMWMAQVSLWIQQDIVKAIAEVNEAAASQIKEGDVYVQHMPVKHLVSTTLHGYQMPENRAVPLPAIVGGSEPAPRSFTGRAGDDQVDVLRFTVVVVMDQRDVLALVDALTKVNLYKCIGLRYEAVPDALIKEGYKYGTEPVVLAAMDFEAYHLRSVFDPLMPKEMREALSGSQQQP